MARPLKQPAYPEGSRAALGRAATGWGPTDEASPTPYLPSRAALHGAQCGVGCRPKPPRPAAQHCTRTHPRLHAAPTEVASALVFQRCSGAPPLAGGPTEVQTQVPLAPQASALHPDSVQRARALLRTLAWFSPSRHSWLRDAPLGDLPVLSHPERSPLLASQPLDASDINACSTVPSPARSSSFRQGILPTTPQVLRPSHAELFPALNVPVSSPHAPGPEMFSHTRLHTPCHLSGMFLPPASSFCPRPGCGCLNAFAGPQLQVGDPSLALSWGSAPPLPIKHPLPALRCLFHGLAPRAVGSEGRALRVSFSCLSGTCLVPRRPSRSI